MSPVQFAIRSLRFHWRSNTAVALGVMAATAVLTGALVVGDSVRGSLRGLVTDRLGKVDDVLVTPHFFREQQAADLANEPSFKSQFDGIAPAIMLQGTIENASSDAKVKQRAGNVGVLGIGPEFWSWGSGGPKKPPTGDEIVLNEPLAEELHAKIGDEVVLRLPTAAEVPADSPLGRKTETVRSRRFTVSEIVPAEGLGRFGMQPTQLIPLNAFTSISPLQQMLAVDGRVNAILAAGDKQTDGAQYLDTNLHPTLTDYGVLLKKTPCGYFNLTSDRMLIEPAIEKAATKAFAADSAQPTFTYLANYILAGDGRGKIPYSTIAAVDFVDAPPLGPMKNKAGETIGPLQDDEIALNSWAADDLAAQGVTLKPGDAIEIQYFEPESTHGKVTETKHTFRLKDIVQLEGAADDRNFTPEVKGVTDEASIADWNPPFPYYPDRVRSTPPNNQDEQYWQKYRATPKAFVNLAQGRQLWASRFGNTSSIRIPPREGITEQSLSDALLKEITPKDLGFTFLPIKQMSLQAAAGTTPFAVLFLGFSMFIIAAALMLVLLLFRLSVDARAAEIGIVLAVGLQRSKARRMLLLEGALVAAIGALFGVIVGVGYAWLMLAGLKTWWLGAISTPFLHLFVSGESLAIGYISGVLVSLATIVWALRQMRRASVRRLLSGQADEGFSLTKRKRRLAPWIAALMIVGAIALGFSGMSLRDEAQAGAFFGAGALVLIALMLLIRDYLRADHGGALVGGSGALARLAVRNGGRFPTRSTLTIGLMASACFLIVAVSAFQLDPPKNGPTLGSGDGGFALIAQTDQPIYQDLNSADARRELGFDSKADELLAAAITANGPAIYPLRVQRGDDASCLNLYQPRQPRILGVNDEFIRRGGFAWVGTAATTEAEGHDPWQLLEGKSTDDAVPVVLDQNTALYSLHLYNGPGEVFEIDSPRGGKIKLRVVGLLKNSIFQGDLLVSEANFLKLFPDVSGYRYFLIATNETETQPIAQALETQLGDYGFDTQTTGSRLAEFFAVQNTYLATFRSLGGLGLLLGTLGLATVQLRNVIERRRELALLRAAGFRQSRLATLVMLENAALLVAGLATGIIAALVALAPHLFTGGAGIPWASLAAMLAIVLVVGLLAGLAAVSAAVRAPILEALRGE
jgi:putative ABC transport system permease protein